MDNETTQTIQTNQPRFTLEDQTHGSGGFGRVIRGRDNILEREIAVKTIDSIAETFTEAEQERFRREARILASLTHTNIPAIYDVDFNSGKFQIIFQFIPGKNLKKVIEEEGPCDISQAKVWFHQIASALEYAHKHNVIHRDVKPDNIIITPDKEAAYLVVFGIALTAEDVRRLTSSGYVIGTPGYMSPEQQAGDPLDSRTDIYSLAVTLYEALAGKAIPVGHYEPLSSVNEAIPPQIDDLISDSLLPKDQRLDSMRVFMSRLAGALQPARPLSDVLVHGRLHELAVSLETLSPAQFVRLPEGQRVLILAKVADLVTSDEPKLEFAAERFLEMLLTRGILLPKEDFREIVVPALDWGFTKEFGGYLGRPSVRAALGQAAYEARGDAHEVLRGELAIFLGKIDLESKEEWYLHALRDLIESLLANPVSVDGIGDLALSLRELNKVHRRKAAARASRQYTLGEN